MMQNLHWRYTNSGSITTKNKTILMILTFKRFINESLLPNQTPPSEKHEEVYKTNHFFIKKVDYDLYKIYINNVDRETFGGTMDQAIQMAKNLINKDIEK